MTVLPSWVIRVVGYCTAVLLAAATLWLVVKALSAVLTVSFAIAAALLLSALISPVAHALRSLRLPDWLASLTTLVLFLAAVLLTSAFTDAVPSPMSGATMAVQFLSGAVLALFLMFFLLKSGADMWSWFVGWLPARHRRIADESGLRAWSTLTSYVRGTAVVASIDALGIGAGMFVVGNPLTASLTVATFIGAFVPIVGAFVTGALAVLLTLATVGFWAAVILLLVVVGVQQLEGNVLQPLIMGHALRLSPVAIVLAVSVGSLVGGIIGAIVAVPVTAVTYRVVSYLAGREPEPEPD